MSTNIFSQIRGPLWYYQPCIFTSRAFSNVRSVTNVVQQWIQKFKAHNINEPEASAEYITAHALGLRTLHNVSKQKVLMKTQIKEIEDMCKLRLTNMPVQYVIGEWDFLDLTLTMKPPVLIPRPETEELVLQCQSSLQQASYQPKAGILEVGCGSGAISLSLLQKFPKLCALAVDITSAACSLTLENAERNGLSDRISVIHGDFCSEKVFDKLKVLGPYLLVVSNPPYLTTDEIRNLQPEIKNFEDHVALNGGQDGLEIIKEIILKAADLLQDDGHLWLEVSTHHPQMIARYLDHSIPGNSVVLIDTIKDIFGKDRFCHLKKKQYTT